MVKFNLLDDPEGKGKPRESKPENADFNTQSSEIDFSFFQPQQELPKHTAEPDQPLSEDNTVKQHNPFSERENFRRDYEESASFENVYRKRRVFLYLGIAIIMLIAVLFILLLRGSDDKSEEASTAGPEKTTAENGQSALPDNQNQVPVFLQQQYSDNQNANLNNLNVVNRILNTRAANTNLSLLVVAADHLYLSVLGDSRDDIAEFRRALKERIPNIRLNTEAAEDRYVDGKKKLLASFSTPVSSTGSGQPLSNIKIIDTDRFQSSLRSLAQRHNLQIAYFKQGDQERLRNFRKVYYYVNVRGAQSSVIKYLQEMSQDFPAINIFKISLYPASTNTMNGGTIIGRIELIFYAPLSS